MFFYVLIVLTIIFALLILLEICIDFDNILIDTNNIPKVNPSYKITVRLRLLRKFTLFKITITKDSLKKLNIKNKLSKLNFSNINLSILKRIDIKDLKHLKVKIDYINLALNVGVEDAAITSYIVGVLSSILGVLFQRVLERNNKNSFIINPIFRNSNLLKMELNCIFTIKMIHIIYIIFILLIKRRDDKNVRTSNRRSYGYSYE